ncbi:hypothetical protein GDO81_013457 [Engystomops pustulosus]|uniref:Progesterone receptor n=1 Tax=Engystomops pustulosus TaxID=76066 RepID=A0AAV7B2Z0_ENGPU|nr:hypothetical protein GDO81_013457 [Engystomops pustulosus]
MMNWGYNLRRHDRADKADPCLSQTRSFLQQRTTQLLQWLPVPMLTSLINRALPHLYSLDSLLQSPVLQLCMRDNAAPSVTNVPFLPALPQIMERT